MVRVLLSFLVALPLFAQTLTLRTLAGSMSGGGSADGARTVARFSSPSAIAADAVGNLYVADTLNHTIRKITAAGVVTTIAGAVGVPGFADGPGLSARFQFPRGIAVDPVSGAVWISDAANHVIRRITPDGVVTTVAGAAGVRGAANGAGTKARFASPQGLMVDAAGNVYVADRDNFAIRRIAPDGMVTTFAGTMGARGDANGSVTTATFNFPTDITLDPARGTFYVSDEIGYRIRKITAEGVVSTLAGNFGGFQNGAGIGARFSQPTSIDVDNTGVLYVTDLANAAVRRITPAGVVTTIAGNGSIGAEDGIGAAARFWRPSGIAVGADGAVYVADASNHAIRRIALPAGEVTTFAGSKPEQGTTNGNATAARFFFPIGVAVDATGNTYVAHSTVISKIAPDGMTTTLAGAPGVRDDGDGVGTAARFGEPISIAIAPDGNLFVADWYLSTIRRVTPDGVVTTVAGIAGELGYVDGPAQTALFDDIWGIAVDSLGVVYVSELGNNAIRRITPDGTVSTLAGSSSGTAGFVDGVGAEARFFFPSGLAVDGQRNVYVADYWNYAIRKITQDGVVSTIVGPSSGLRRPTGVASDADGNLYVVDERHVIYRITNAGAISIVAGVLDAPGNVNGAGNRARVSFPQQLALTPSGSLVIADTDNHAIRIAAPGRRRPMRR